MSNSKHSYTCVVEGVILGASMGAAAGYLFAPRAERTLKRAGSLYTNIHNRTERAFAQASKAAESKLDSIKEILGRD